MPAANDLDGLNKQAGTHYEGGEFRAAAEGFLAASRLAREQGNLHMLAVALANLGAAYGAAEDFHAALASLEEARKVFQENGDWLGECQANISMATTLGHLKREEDCAATWQAALELARRMQNPGLAAIATSGLAEALGRLGKPDEALAIYQKLLGYYEKITDISKQVNTLIEMARLELEQGATTEVEKHVQRALSLARKAGDRQKEAYCLYKLGATYQYTGFNQEARDLLLQSVGLYRSLGDPAPLGMALNSLAMVYDNLGRFQDALDAYQEALKIAEDQGKKNDQGGALHGIGFVYHQVGRFDDALAYYHRALRLTEEVGDWRSAALTLTNIGVITGDMGRDEEALPILQQALYYQKKAGDRISQGHTLISIAALMQKAGDIERALKTLEEALEIQRQVGDRNSQAVTFANRAEILSELGRSADALEEKGKALVLFREVANPVGQIQALYGIARFHARDGNLRMAVEVLDQAVSLIENMRLNLVSESLRTSYFAHMQNIYALYVEVLMAMERRADAFKMVERSKARAFLDLLSEAQSNFQADLDPVLRAEELRLLESMDSTRRSLDALAAKGNAIPQAELATHRDKLQELERKYQIHQGEIRRSNPRYSALTAPVIWGIEEVQRELLDDHTALLEYILGERVSTLFVVLKDSFEVFRLPPRAEIETKVRELRASLTLPRYLHGDTLYSDLVAPAEALVRGKDLLIVADSALHYLPFALLLTRPPDDGALAGEMPGTLRSGEAFNLDDLLTEKLAQQIAGLPPFDFPRLPYLVSEHAIRSIPSASAAGFIPAEQAPGGQGVQIVALADPQIPGGSDLPAAAVRSLRAGMAPLPFTSQEVWALAGLFEPDLPLWHESEFHSSRVALFTAEKATRAQVIALTDGSHDYRFLHIATHGLLNLENPQFSGLLFSPEGGKPAYWQTFEIFQAHIPAGTVVLSACETGLGKLVRGEGLIGLTRAFLYAGAQRVCVSLWKVADISTPGLMKYFYESMLAGERPAQALRAAQLRLIEAGRYSHPYFWAAFSLVGAG